MNIPPLGRDVLPHKPPVRIVHLGLGAFHRSHQAWYTAKAADAAHWGIAAYTGRTPEAAATLAAQDGVYTLIERAADHDLCEPIGSIVRAVAGDDVDDFTAALADPAVAILTLTITEAGYRLDPNGNPDLADPEVAADIECLRDRAWASPRTALGRVLAGLAARHRKGAPPIAVVPCDNLPGNGAAVERALTRLAEKAGLPGVLDGVAFVSTSVDRITPRTAPADIELVARATGRLDRAPVVAEPFSDWVLSGEFPSGRPAWETAGARFTDDIGPWERRKLWLLNGAHTLLAASGTLRGHRTVADAIADPLCRNQVEALWDEAERHLPDVEVRDYRAALLERFANPRIEHRLSQINEDSRTKLRLRIAPVALAERAAGRPASGCAAAIAAWLLAQGPARPSPQELLTELSPALAADDAFRAELAHATDLIPTV
ncbi:mannitol dehydrogenase family protein [Glycomyces sp. NPDC048151]|uniref:mannitol dehydrogenase family protein n=1 Tax=Glycomyces sp. NPDC048151 TaxID=3364002 RepID=UPI00371526F0